MMPMAESSTSSEPDGATTKRPGAPLDACAGASAAQRRCVTTRSYSSSRYLEMAVCHLRSGGLHHTRKELSNAYGLVELVAAQT